MIDRCQTYFFGISSQMNLPQPDNFGSPQQRCFVMVEEKRERHAHQSALLGRLVSTILLMGPVFFCFFFCFFYSFDKKRTASQTANHCRVWRQLWLVSMNLNLLPMSISIATCLPYTCVMQSFPNGLCPCSSHNLKE